jgi:glycosyltransferase involved in cell wall biosynthesis
VPLDLARLRRDPTLSLIIPAFNEAQSLEATLRALASRAANPGDLEVVIVDAGGSDGTMAIARRVAAELQAEGCGMRFRLGVCVYKGGRGPTLAAGVDASSGPMVLFLHADTLLPRHFDALVRGSLALEGTLATAFRFKVGHSHNALCVPLEEHE